MEQKIAVIAGDGIGPEVINEAVNILQYFQEEEDLDLSITHLPWSSEYYLEHGKMMPEDGLETLKQYDAVLFGAIGDARVPDDVSVWELIMPIRKGFQQYVNFRPIKSLANIETPLASKAPIDFVIFRENSEGEYSNSGGTLSQNEPHEMSIQNTVMSRVGIERLTRAACEYAVANGLTKITSATKSNAIVHVMKFWDKVVKEVVSEYPTLELENVYIDALATYFVERPESFEVVIASNLYGDILSDLGSSLVGGLGVSPSANLNPEKNFPSMFEAIHGSAPTIAGQNKANPIATIWSAGLMLNHFGRADLGNRIFEAIDEVLKDNVVATADLGGTSTTEEMGAAILGKLRKSSNNA